MRVLSVLVLDKFDIDWELKTFNIFKNSAPQILGMFSRIEYDNGHHKIILYEEHKKNVFAHEGWFEELDV